MDNFAKDRVVIVVPCYNEARRLDSNAFLSFLDTEKAVDFIFVNDGSSDETGALLDRLADAGGGRLLVRHLEHNSGKAEAVRQGMLMALAQSRAKYVGFWDADLATPLTTIPVFVASLDRLSRVDFVIGSRVRLLGHDIDRKLARHLLGRVFATAASLVLSLPVYDTQCGAKLFRADDLTRRLFQQPFLSRWIFDVELLARFQREKPGRGGVYELPVDSWQDVGESKVSRKDFVRAIGEMARIYRCYRVADRYQRPLAIITAPFTRYVGVGAIGTAVHFALLMLCVELFFLPATIGAALGATAGALTNYWLNYHITFASRSQHRRTLPRFLTVALAGIGLNTAIMYGLTEQMTVHYLLAQAVSTAAVLVVGFSLNRVWTFWKDAD